MRMELGRRVVGFSAGEMFVVSGGGGGGGRVWWSFVLL